MFSDLISCFWFENNNNMRAGQSLSYRSGASSKMPAASSKTSLH